MTENLSREALGARVRELESTVSKYETELSAFKNHEKRYQSLFQNILYEVHIWELVRDDHGNILTWRLLDANPAALKIWDKKLEDVIGKTTDVVFPNSNATETFMPIVKKIFADDQPHAWEQHFSGTGQTLNMVSIPLGDTFISSGIDVSEHIRIEKELKESVLQLSESVTAGHVGLWDWNLGTNQTRFSKEWKAQLGYGENELKDRFEEWEKLVHPDDLAGVTAAIKHSVATANKNHLTEARLKHKDGSYRWILAHGTVIQDELGTPVRMIGSHVDITKTKLLEKSINQTQKSEALGFLASGIAHDFNNLLVPILGYNELAKKSLPENSKEKEYLDLVQMSAIRAKDLVEKILTINRSSQTQRATVSLSELTNEVCAILRSSTPKNIKIRQEEEADIPLISANSSEIYQVILNLCTNSIQAMPDGGDLIIRVEKNTGGAGKNAKSTESKRFVSLSIEDSGCGMDSVTLSHAFDPFFTTKEKSEQRGTGLGLAIVFGIIKQHGGHINVESEKGTGTLVQMFFPASSMQEDNLQEQQEQTLVSGDARILLIDDEEIVGKLNSRILEELGYRVTSYSDAREALDDFEADHENFDLIITDVAMPNFSGQDLIKSVKKISATVPVVVLTGYSNLSTPENARAWGCAEIISKPCNMMQLDEVVKRALATRSV